MRLYLSSYRVGERPEELTGLVREGRKTALISNALDHVSAEDRSASVAEQVSALEALGLEATELDLRDWFDDPAEVEETLSGFDLLWVRGGNTFILRRALAQSGADSALVALLRRDAIAYAGYSAGVCVLAPSLAGLELVDFPDRIPPRYEVEVVWDGLNVLAYAVVPHHRSDHPESEGMEAVVGWYEEHAIPFVALRDGEAIVVRDGVSRIVNREGDRDVVVRGSRRSPTA